MSWLFGKKQGPLKDGLHDPQEWQLEPEEMVTINVLHINARRMSRVGDRPGEMIFEHHRQEAIREFEKKYGLMVRYDADLDRWYTQE